MADDAPCVLVVDDDPDLRVMLCAILEAEGYTVDSAADGLEALAQLQARQPHVIVADLQMPRMTGQELLGQLRQLPVHIPVVFMTAGLRAELEAEQHGADGFLAKPFELDDLLQLVARLCG